MIFSNGLWPDAVREDLAYLARQDWDLRILFNVNEPQMQPPSQWARARESMRAVGARGRCGFNIYRAGFDLQFIADLVEAYGLDPVVRLGLAAPIAGGGNCFLSSESLPAIGRRLAGQLRDLEKRDVLGSFDCGFPLCMFSEEDLGALRLATCASESVCRFPIDVGPDLTAWPCFPLSNFQNVRLQDFRDKAEVVSYYDKKLSAFRSIGTMEACLECKYLRRGQCCGGCVARTLKDWLAADSSLMDKLAAVEPSAASGRA